MIRHRNDASNAWKGISEEIDTLKKGWRKLPRNGKESNFWTEAWLLDEPLINYALRDIRQEKVHAKVANYWVRQVGWDWERLEGMLTISIERKLMGYMLAEDDHCNDMISWKGDPSGTFSVTSAYNCIHANEGDENDGTWRNIWRLKVPSKMKVFLWLVYHQRIMSNDMRARRGFAILNNCHRCPNAKEDVDHILRSCPNAKDVWRKIAPNRVMQNAWKKPFLTWVGDNVRNRERPGGAANWNTTFAVTVWWLWRWRNDQIFNDSHMMIKEKVAWIRRQEMEINRAFKNALTPGGTKEDESIRWLKWKKPERGWIALNTDGCVMTREARAGYGSTLRDNEGNWINGFTMDLGTCTIDEAEA